LVIRMPCGGVGHGALYVSTGPGAAATTLINCWHF
jgi:hypothetical protein